MVFSSILLLNSLGLAGVTGLVTGAAVTGLLTGVKFCVCARGLDITGDACLGIVPIVEPIWGL